jgi:HD-like signal output (HDOD) protein
MLNRWDTDRYPRAHARFIMTESPAWLENTALEVRMTSVVNRVGEVCPLPATAQRVLALASGERPTVPELAKVIATDPALAAEVLRIANSSAFGRSRKVSDLQQAITTIGLANLRHMASAMAMLAAFATDQELFPQLHRSSAISASLARGLAAHLPGVDAGSAFLAGLLCEIGAMACLAVDADGFDNLWNACGRTGEHRSRLERARYGATTMQIGGQLLFRNQLSADVALAVEAAPDSEVADANSLQRIVIFSRAAAPLLLLAANEGDATILSEEIPRLAERLQLPISPADLSELCIEAAEAAELGLRERLGLSTTKPVDGGPQAGAPGNTSEVLTPAEHTQRARIDAKGKAETRRRRAEAMRWVVPLIVTAAIAVMGTAAVLLLR